MEKPRYKLVGGPLDGATQFAGRISGFPDGRIGARVRGLRDGYSLCYQGHVSFCGAMTKLYFVGWLPDHLELGRPSA